MWFVLGVGIEQISSGCRAERFGIRSHHAHDMFYVSFSNIEHSRQGEITYSDVTGRSGGCDIRKSSCLISQLFKNMWI